MSLSEAAYHPVEESFSPLQPCNSPVSLASSPSETYFEDTEPWPRERLELTIAVRQHIAARPWFNEWLREAVELFNLPPSWNGYGEQAVHGASIKRAAAILDQLDYDRPTAPAMTPLHDGGIQLEWHFGEDSIEVVVPPRGSAEAWLFGDDEEESWNAITSKGLTKLRHELEKYFRSYELRTGHGGTGD